jgi:hypothetical protein
LPPAVKAEPAKDTALVPGVKLNAPAADNVTVPPELVMALAAVVVSVIAPVVVAVTPLPKLMAPAVAFSVRAAALSELETEMPPPPVSDMVGTPDTVFRTMAPAP